VIFVAIKSNVQGTAYLLFLLSARAEEVEFALEIIARFTIRTDDGDALTKTRDREFGEF
jgi:hypothetical protein